MHVVSVRVCGWVYMCVYAHACMLEPVPVRAHMHVEIKGEIKWTVSVMIRVGQNRIYTYIYIPYIW